MNDPGRPGRPLRCLAAVSLVLVVGCASPDDPIPCDDVPECPVVDEEAAEDDVRVLWAEGQTLEMALDGEASEIEVESGEVVFTPDPADPNCDGPCSITLKRLTLTLKTLYFVSSQDSVRVSGLTLAFKGPSVLDNPDGSASILPVSAETLTCATVEDIPWASAGTLGQEGRLVARATTEELTFEALVPMTVNGSTDQGCQPFALELGGTLQGATPFEQNPASAASRK
jgi:hypothetical protein